MQNLTSTGFRKSTTPEPLSGLLSDLWVQNQDYQRIEQWTIGNTYVNHWKAPTYLVSMDEVMLTTNTEMGLGLRGSSVSSSASSRNEIHVQEELWQTARSELEGWTGMELRPSSAYGIRVYTDGAIEPPKVERLPLVTSVLILIAQGVREPWPLEVYDRSGMAVNITMTPGDMLLYESHSLIHGRLDNYEQRQGTERTAEVFITIDIVFLWLTHKSAVSALFGNPHHSCFLSFLP